mmetsp:Transcript_1659/g.2944  ORF Transcript_1659/g.2944 Transcript_1659/m.2944 type:complete len:81 (+) Transcript_1659:312-554(+)
MLDARPGEISPATLLWTKMNSQYQLRFSESRFNFPRMLKVRRAHEYRSNNPKASSLLMFQKKFSKIWLNIGPTEYSFYTQ